MRTPLLFGSFAALLAVAVGCGGALPALEHGELLRHETLVHDGLDRDFHLYVSDADGPRPLVVVLHGGFATIDAVVGIGTGASPLGGMWLKVADEEGLHVVVPQGVDRHWNDCRADCDHCPDTDDAGFLLALIDHVATRAEVDSERVFVAGESNGGFMTQRMALEHGGRFRGAAVVNAGWAADFQCTDAGTPVPIVHILGTDDLTIPWEGGQSNSEGSGSVLSSDEAMSRWADRNQCAGEPVSAELPDLDAADASTVAKETWTCAAGSLERFAVTGGGHVVPSIEEPVSRAWEKLVGEQNHDIETVREMWSFFQALP